VRENWHDDRAGLAAKSVLQLLTLFIPEARPLEVTRMSEGLSNTTYRIRIREQQQPMILRVYERADSADVELAVLKSVAGRVPVPRVLYNVDANPATGTPCAILEYVERMTLTAAWRSLDADGQLQLGSAVGEVLAALRSIAFESAGMFNARLQVVEEVVLGSDTFLRYAHAAFDSPAFHGRVDRELASLVQSFVHREAKILDRVTMAPHLVHGDFDPTNLIVNCEGGKWRVAGVLDWEHAFSGPALLDIGHILRPPHGRSAEFEAGLVQGLTRGAAALPADWKRASVFVDLLAWFEFLARERIPHGVAETARERIACTIAEWGDGA